MKTSPFKNLTFLLLATLCFTVFDLTAQDSPYPIGPTTTIEFEETEYDFGTIMQGEKVKQVYTFTNTGDEPFIISNAKGSCGCTVPKWPREPIAPGASAEIIVEFNSKGKKGKRNQKVTVTGNTNPPQTFISLKGEVIVPEEEQILEAEPVEIEDRSIDEVAEPVYPATPTTPAYPAWETPTGPTTTMTFDVLEHDFGIVEEGTKVSQVFTFTNTGEEPLILSDAKGSCGCTVPEWPRDPIAPGETASITVEFNTKNKRGKRNQKVTITANTNPPQTFVYLKGEVMEKEGSDIVIDGVEVDTPNDVEPEAKEKPNCLNVYPNPTSDVLNLEMHKSTLGLSAIISIHSYKGQLMAARNIDEIQAIIEFDVRHYPAGSYVATIQVEGQPAETRCFVVSD